MNDRTVEHEFEGYVYDIRVTVPDVIVEPLNRSFGKEVKDSLRYGHPRVGIEQTEVHEQLMQGRHVMDFARNDGPTEVSMELTDSQVEKLSKVCGRALKNAMEMGRISESKELLLFWLDVVTQVEEQARTYGYDVDSNELENAIFGLDPEEVE